MPWNRSCAIAGFEESVAAMFPWSTVLRVESTCFRRNSRLGLLTGASVAEGLTTGALSEAELDTPLDAMSRY